MARVASPTELCEGDLGESRPRTIHDGHALVLDLGGVGGGSVWGMWRECVWGVFECVGCVFECVRGVFECVCGVFECVGCVFECVGCVEGVCGLCSACGMCSV